MKKKITIPYFPRGMKYSTPLLLGETIHLFLIGYPIWGVLLTLLGVIILTTHYVTEINLDEKAIHDYLSFLALKLNKVSKRFNGIDRIVISKGNYSQTINTRAQSRQLDWSDYTGTLILDNDTLDLVTTNDKKELLIELKAFSGFLKVPVEDRTTNQYYWVDMERV
jgi:hypothetical protein